MMANMNGIPSEERRHRAGLAIRRAREQKGWTGTELAARVSAELADDHLPGRSQTVGQSAVSRWETGENAPEAWKLPVIERVLGLNSGSLAMILYDRPTDDPEGISALAARLDQVEGKVDQMLDLLHDLRRQLPGMSPSGA